MAVPWLGLLLLQYSHHLINKRVKFITRKYINRKEGTVESKNNKI